MSDFVFFNGIFTLVFGVVLTLSFADIDFKTNIKHYVCLSFIYITMQVIIFFIFGETFLFRVSPLVIHFFLFLLLKLYYKKSSYISAIAVLSAYLFCTPRKWIGTFISVFFGNNVDVSEFTQILLTFPLVIIIIKYISPYVVRLKFEEDKVLKLFVSVPFIYYIIEFSLTVYTDLLYSGKAVIIEFMDAAVVMVYFVFSIIYLKTLYEKKEIEVQQILFTTMANQSKLEIDALRKSENQTNIYRHDLRHHLNYLNTCMTEQNFKDGTEYIASIYEKIDSATIKYYSKNESLNLILSSYVYKATKKNIHCEVKVTATNFARFDIPDLCSLLSNGLENAIRACEKMQEGSSPFISLRIFEKGTSLCIDMQNSYDKVPVFENDLPISKEKGHGVGVKSMVYVVEKYDGVYQFWVKDGVFMFQVSIETVTGG